MNCSSKKGLRRDVSQSTTAFQEIIFLFGNEGLEFNIKRENEAKICRNGLPAVFEATYRMSKSMIFFLMKIKALLFHYRIVENYVR